MPRSWLTRRRIVIALTVIVGGSGVLWGLDRSYNAPARAFLRTVQIGMTRDRVQAVAGEPRERVAKGATQWPWGDTPERIVPGEAWVYYFGPGSIYRITILFQGGIVAAIFAERT